MITKSYNKREHTQSQQGQSLRNGRSVMDKFWWLCWHHLAPSSQRIKEWSQRRDKKKSDATERLRPGLSPFDGGNSHSADERGVPSNSLAQQRQGLSLPAAQETRTHTHTRTHYPRAKRRKRSPLVDTHTVDRLMADLTGLWQTLVHPNTHAQTRNHAGRAQWNWCQLNLLSKAALRATICDHDTALTHTI